MLNLRIKPIENLLSEKDGDRNSLARVLGPVDLTALGVGAIIGTGIFVLTGIASANYAGPGIVLSFVLAGIASALAALIYAEMSSMIPVAGSAYTFTYGSLGEIPAWLVGWNLILEYIVASGAVAIGWSSYFSSLLGAAGLTLPPSLTTSPFEGGIVNLPALLVVLLMTALVIAGTRQSSFANKIVVAAKVSAIVLFIILGARHVDPVNWTPFLPFGVTGIFHGAAIVFFAYIGFDAVSTAAEEVKNPKRDLSIGIVASLGIATVLYLLVSLVLTGIMPYNQLNTASPVAAAMLRVGLPWAAAAISIGALAGLTSVLLVMLYGQSRIFFAIARDGLLPPIFCRLNPKYRTPAVNSLLVGFSVAVIGALLPITVVAELANIGTLSAFSAVAAGFLVLRAKRPDIPRPFRAPWSPWLPLLSIFASLYLAANLPSLTWIRFGVWILIGLVIYLAYSRKHSLMAGKEKPFKVPQPAFKKSSPRNENDRSTF